MDLAFLTTAILITLYFMVGAWLEEKKLLIYHGEQYRRFQKEVPMLFPLPWRFLTRGEAREIEGSAAQDYGVAE
jgi:hypothetical protein